MGARAIGFRQGGLGFGFGLAVGELARVDVAGQVQPPFAQVSGSALCQPSVANAAILNSPTIPVPFPWLAPVSETGSARNDCVTKTTPSRFTRRMRSGALSRRSDSGTMR